MLLFYKFLLYSLFSFSPAPGEHRIEVYVFNERCIPIEYLTSNQSFYESWYTSAKKFKPQGVPILTNHDIINFDTQNFQIEVSDQGWEHFSDLEIPTSGIPVMLVIDGKVSYGAWIWTPLSSSTCAGVSFLFMPSSEKHILSIHQGSNQNEWRIPAELK